MPTPAIQVESLSKNYGPVLAVNNVSFQVQPGELVGFLGPNGAGKSTTMRILTTYLPASSGYAYVAGYDVMYQSMEVRERIGYLPESVPLYPEMRVSEYLGYRARLKSVPRTGRVARLDDLMTRCRIKEVKNRLLGTLSKGYRQRVGLADAMLNEPPVLILDEPTSGLDPIQIAQTLETIKALGGRHTVLLSTHILSEVEKICERVIIINKGQVKFDDTLHSIAQREPVLQVEVRGPADEVARFLRDQSDLSSVTAGPAADGVTAFELRTKNRQDLRESLAAKLTARGWGVRRLDLKRASLEDQYMQVVLRQDAAPEPAAPAPVGADGEPLTGRDAHAAAQATEPPAPPAA
jgi:ABC-2 type transport system ATP-binding protein